MCDSLRVHGSLFASIVVILLLVVSSGWAQYGDPTPRNGWGMDGSVNAATGELFLSATDIQAPGRGLALNYTRAFASQTSFGASLNSLVEYVGAHWTHNYNWFSEYLSNPFGDGYDYYRIYRGDGGQDLFKMWSGAPTPGPGVHAHLEEVTTNPYELLYTTKSGIKRTATIVFSG